MRALLTLLHAACILAWVVFLVSTIGQVLARYVFQAPLQWAEEVARFGLIWFVFLGAVILTAEDGHILIDVLTRRARGVLRTLLEGLSLTTQLLFAGMLAYGSWTLVQLAGRTSAPATGLSMGLWYAAGTVSGVLGAGLLLWRFLTWIWKGLRANASPTAGNQTASQ